MPTEIDDFGGIAVEEPQSQDKDEFGGLSLEGLARTAVETPIRVLGAFGKPAPTPPRIVPPTAQLKLNPYEQARSMGPMGPMGPVDPSEILHLADIPKAIVPTETVRDFADSFLRQWGINPPPKGEPYFQLERTSPEQQKLLSPAMQAVAGGLNALTDVAEGFIQPESAALVPGLAGESAIAKLATTVLGAQQFEELPEQAQNAFKVLSDPNSTIGQRTQALLAPGVSTILGGAMMKHGARIGKELPPTGRDLAMRPGAPLPPQPPPVPTEPVPPRTAFPPGPAPTTPVPPREAFPPGPAPTAPVPPREAFPPGPAPGYPPGAQWAYRPDVPPGPAPRTAVPPRPPVPPEVTGESLAQAVKETEIIKGNKSPAQLAAEVPMEEVSQRQMAEILEQMGENAQQVAGGLHVVIRRNGKVVKRAIFIDKNLSPTEKADFIEHEQRHAQVDFDREQGGKAKEHAEQIVKLVQGNPALDPELHAFIQAVKDAGYRTDEIAGELLAEGILPFDKLSEDLAKLQRGEGGIGIRHLEERAARRVKKQAGGRPPPETSTPSPAPPVPPRPPAPTIATPITDFNAAAQFNIEQFNDWLTEHKLNPTNAAYQMADAIKTPEDLAAAEKHLADVRAALDVDKQRARDLQKTNPAAALEQIKRNVAYVGKVQYFDEGIKMYKARQAVAGGMTTDEAATKFGVNEKFIAPKAKPEPVAPTVAQPGTPAAPAPAPGETAPAKPTTFEQTPVAGKTIGDWEAVTDAAGLPKGDARAALAKWLAVKNQPAAILKALANKKRTREIHAPPMPIEEAAAAPPATPPTPAEPVAPPAETKAPVAETKPAEAATVAPVSETVAPAAKAQAEVSKVAATEGQRPAKEVKSELVQRLEDAIKTAKSEKDSNEIAGDFLAIRKGPPEKGKNLTPEAYQNRKADYDRTMKRLEETVGKVTIDIPGDGRFEIWNTKEALGSVLERAKAISIKPTEPVKVSRSGIPKKDKDWIEQQLKEQPPSDLGPTGGIGPGAASAAEFTARENRRRLLGNITERLFGTRAAEVVDALQRKLAGEAVPKTMARSGEAGNKMVRFAAATTAGPAIARAHAVEVLGDKFKDVEFRNRLGAVLVEDRLRAIQKGLMDAANKAEGDAQFDLLSQASDVNTLVGKGKPFATERDYQAALRDPEIAAAIERHKQGPQVDALQFHTEAEGQFAGPGVQTGAFVNLLPIFEDNPQQIFASARKGDYTRPFKRRSIFARRAKGTAEKYETDYLPLVERMIQGNYEEYTKRQLYDQLVKDGLAVIDAPGRPRPTFDGKPAEKFQIRRQVTVSRGPEGTRVIPQYENLWVDPAVAPELRQAENLGSPVSNVALARVANVLNRIQLAGPTDAVWHIANMMSTIAGSQGGKSLLADLARKLPLVNAVDAAVRVVSAGKKVLANDPAVMQQIAELSEIGAVRAARPQGWFTSRLINLVDKAGRVVRDDMYKNLVNRGLVEPSEVGRREFVNQLGQYNPRIMGQIESFFKEVGLSPFVVAGRNFNRMALRRISLSPGVRAANLKSAAAMRAVEATGVIATLVAIPTLLNTVLTGSPTGRKGVPFGTIDTGKNDKNGKMIYIDPAQWIGLRRGMRLTGINALIEGMRRGQPAKQIGKQAIHDIIGAAVHPWAGPVVQVPVIGATGYTTSFYKESKDPGDYWQNFLAAMRNVNPLLHGWFQKQGTGITPGVESAVSTLSSAAGIKTRAPLSTVSQVHDLANSWASRSEDPKIRSEYEQHTKESFSSEYQDLRGALLRNDTKGAREAYQELRQKGKKPSAIRQTMQHPHPFTGSAAAEAKFKRSLSPEDRKTYDQAIEERRELYRKFQQMLNAPQQ